MIIAAAIRFDGDLYALPAPARHSDIIRWIVAHTEHERVPFEPMNQGFIDSHQGYVSRADAWLLAKMSGQLLDRAPTDGRGGELYSEDVW